VPSNEFENCNLDDITDLAWCGTAPNLTELQLDRNTGLTSLDGISFLGKTPLLRICMMRFCSIVDIKGLWELGPLPKLERLAVNGNNILTLAGIENIGPLDSIQELWLAGNEWTDLSPLAAIEQPLTLEWIQLQNGQLTTLLPLRSEWTVPMPALNQFEVQANNLTALDVVQSLRWLDVDIVATGAILNFGGNAAAAAQPMSTP